MEKENWPAVFYGPDGQAETFNSPLEVPEGWHDNPAKVGDKKAKTVIPGLDEARAAVVDNEDEETELEREGETEEEDLENEPDENMASNDLEAKDNDDVLPEYDDMTKDDIIDRLEKLDDTSFNKSWDKMRLYTLLEDKVTS